MTKYCIVPENCRILAQLAAGMEMEPGERELLERGFIRHVEITPGANLWEILVWCDGELPRPLLDRCSSYVEAKHHVDKVVFYPTAIKLEKLVEQKWPQLVEFVSKGDHVSKVILDKSRRVYGKNRILLQVQGDFARHILEQHKILEKLTDSAVKVMGYPLRLTCQAVYEEIEAFRQSNQEHTDVTPEYLAALEAVKNAPPVATAQGGGGTGGSYGGSYGSGGGYRSSGSAAGSSGDAAHGGNGSNGSNGNGGKRYRRKQLAIGADDSPIVFGDGIVGELTPISQLQGEMRSVVAQGYIAGVDGKEFANTNMLLFSLADTTEGISCKVFISDHDGYETVLGRLKAAAKAGGMVKVRGPVR